MLLSAWDKIALFLSTVHWKIMVKIKVNQSYDSTSSSVQSLSHVQLFVTPWTAAPQASLSIINSQSLLILFSIELVIPYNHLNLFVFTFNLSQHQGLFQWVSSLKKSGKITGVSAWASVLLMSIQDWFLLGVQGTLKSLQHHSPKASFLQHSAFFVVQLLHPYMSTENTIAFTRWTFVCKVMSLLFDMLSRLVITFLPRSKHLLISWLQSPSAVYGAQENKVCHCFHCFPTYFPWSDGTGCHDLCFLNLFLVCWKEIYKR